MKKFKWCTTTIQTWIMGPTSCACWEGPRISNQQQAYMLCHGITTKQDQAHDVDSSTTRWTGQCYWAAHVQHAQCQVFWWSLQLAGPSQYSMQQVALLTLATEDSSINKPENLMLVGEDVDVHWSATSNPSSYSRPMHSTWQRPCLHKHSVPPLRHVHTKSISRPITFRDLPIKIQFRSQTLWPHPDIHETKEMQLAPPDLDETFSQ